MNLSDFYYDLPVERIAQEPVAERDQSRLLVVDSKSGTLTHARFRDLLGHVQPGDALVLNATKVFPARLRGRKKTGGKVELLLLERLNSPDETWKALVRGATSEAELEFPENLKGVMQRRLSEGEWEIQFSGGDVRDVLERHGEMPLPPYIKRPEPRAGDLARYQTVFAQREGAVAAPTAGFHFTAGLLQELRAKGVQILEIILHVGWGTFRPVRTETIEAHHMLAERYEVNSGTAQALNDTRKAGKRIIAVGTTAVRTLESISDAAGKFSAGSGETSLFIYPGYRFKGVDALITNFHLPDSTPLLLACAFYSHKAAARERSSPFSLKPAYESAIHEGYRFYSYGDAMFIATV
jgi:S-adenosylmethionine:tRNA ribosyltransferase-isomerase